jgi:hypothetical protein
MIATVSLTRIRASSLAELFDCPARWEAKHLLGKRLPHSPAAQLGTAVHAGTAVFDASRLPGGSPVSAYDAAGAVVDAIHQPNEDVNWENTTPKAVEKIALALHTRYCAEIAPQQDYLAVELEFETLEIPELGIALTGTNDRVSRRNGQIGIDDLKTGQRAIDDDGNVMTQKHVAQLGVYELLASYKLETPITAPARIIAMQTGKTPQTQQIGIGEISGARDVLLGTEEAPGMLEYASRLIRSGDFYGNSSSWLCSKKYCPAHATCRFKS